MTGLNSAHLWKSNGSNQALPASKVYNLFRAIYALRRNKVTYE